MELTDRVSYRLGMARRRPESRLPDLVRTAARVFVESGGYQRTQIGDVARALGVAKGTLYLYVQSKDALFDLVVRHADAPDDVQVDLPVPTPAPGSTLLWIAALIDGATLPPLDGPVSSAADAARELDALVTALFWLLHAHRWTIRLIASSARDMPELSELWFVQARARLNRRLADWLVQRAGQGVHRPLRVPAEAVARWMSESVHWAAVSREFDVAPEPLAPDDALATVRLAVGRMVLPPAVAP